MQKRLNRNNDWTICICNKILSFFLNIRLCPINRGISRASCKNIVTGYIKYGSYNSFAWNPRFADSIQCGPAKRAPCTSSTHQGDGPGSEVEESPQQLEGPQSVHLAQQHLHPTGRQVSTNWYVLVYFHCYLFAVFNILFNLH